MSDIETVWCACGDGHKANSYGAGFMAANNGVCDNCDAAAGNQPAGFTAVDMGTAAADGRRSLAEHLIKQIAIEHPDKDTLLTVGHIAQWIALETGL